MISFGMDEGNVEGDKALLVTRFKHKKKTVFLLLTCSLQLRGRKVPSNMEGRRFESQVKQFFTTFLLYVSSNL